MPWPWSKRKPRREARKKAGRQARTKAQQETGHIVQPRPGRQARMKTEREARMKASQETRKKARTQANERIGSTPAPPVASVSSGAPSAARHSPTGSARPSLPTDEEMRPVLAEEMRKQLGRSPTDEELSKVMAELRARLAEMEGRLSSSAPSAPSGAMIDGPPRKH